MERCLRKAYGGIPGIAHAGPAWDKYQQPRTSPDGRPAQPAHALPDSDNITEDAVLILHGANMLRALRSDFAEEPLVKLEASHKPGDALHLDLSRMQIGDRSLKAFASL